MGYTYPLQTNAALLDPSVWAGGAVVWVGNRSGLPAGDGSRPDYPLSSLFGASGGIAKMGSLNKSANRADAVGGLIKVLPGHVESITGSTSLTTLGGSTLTNVNIVGLGNGSQRPTFNWTAAASALLINQAGFAFRNMVWNLNKTAATVVTAAVTISGTDCTLEDVDALPNTSATQLTTTAFTVTSAATGLTCRRLRGFGETFATNPTDFFTTSGAVDRMTLIDCKFMVAVNSTTNGSINLANAPTNVYMENCTFHNKKAASTVAGIASASSTGDAVWCNFSILAAGAATAFSTPGNINMHNCSGSVIGKNTLAITPVST